MFIIRNSKIFISISIGLIALSIFSMFFFGFNVGIDFKGGALSEVSYEGDRPSPESLSPKLEELGFGTITLQPTGETGYIIKSKDLNDEEHRALLAALSDDGASQISETSFTSIGPSVGQELAHKAIIALVLVSLAIVFFIAYAFRKVSKPVSSWKYGLIAIGTLLHDVIIPAGLFVIFSEYLGAELDTLFVVSVLTILGLSVSDTIVIFDRVRENLRLNAEAKIQEEFSTTVGRSLEQSFARSLSTSITVMLSLLALVVFGPETTRYFALMLTAGMFFGTYSSLFVASPLLVVIEKWQHKTGVK